MSNRKLESFLKQQKSKAKQIGSSEDILSILNDIKAFKERASLDFDHTIPKTIVIISSILLVFASLWGYENFKYGNELTVFFVVGSPLIVLLGSLFYISSKNSYLDNIERNLIWADTLFDHKISKSKDDLTKKYSKWRKEFSDLTMGDENKYIKYVYNGKFEGKTHSFNYQFYRYNYTEVYYVPVTRKVGNSTITTIERRTRDCKRFGLVVDKNYIKNVGINCNSNGTSWKSSSKEFNKLFNVYVEDEMEAVKKLKPSVVLHLIEIDKNVSDLSIAFRDNQVFFGFDDGDLLDADHKTEIRDIDNFIKEIKEKSNLEKLNNLLKDIHKLMELTDSNFKGEKK